MRRIVYAIIILAIIILLVWLYFLPDRLDLPSGATGGSLRADAATRHAAAG